MDSLGADVANFRRVFLVEHVLHSQGPGFRVRKLLHRRKEVGRGSALISNGWERLQTRTASSRKTTICQETSVSPVATARAIHALKNIAGAAKLRRNGQKAKIVIQHVIGHAKATANRGVAGRPGRVREANARSKVLVLRLGRHKVNQAGYAGC